MLNYDVHMDTWSQNFHTYFEILTEKKIHCKKCTVFIFAGNFAQLCELISKSGEVLTKNAAHLDNVLGTFDIQQHSLGVLGIL